MTLLPRGYSSLKMMNYNGRMSRVSSCCYCCIELEGLLYDAKFFCFKLFWGLVLYWVKVCPFLSNNNNNNNYGFV